MNRSKKILILLGVLVVVGIAAFAATQMHEKQEQIKTSGEAVLEIDADTVDKVSWKNETESLSFHKDGNWIYDEDEAFPVSGEKMDEMLNVFSSFAAAFTIEDPEDLGQYGLDSPLCTIQLSSGDTEWEIKLGSFSSMDSQRYVSTGDGNVYLAVTDPLDLYSAGLKDMIDHDEVPAFEKAQSIKVEGDENWEAQYTEDSTESYCEDDVWFVQGTGKTMPLDTEQVGSYFADLHSMALTSYVTYNATDEELKTYGLDSPDLTISVDYEGEEDEEDGTFVLHVSRDPEEKAAAEAEEAEKEETGDGSGDASSADSSGDDSSEEEITAFARVGDSPIIYQITGPDYVAVTACAVDDLRHKAMYTGSTDSITGVEVQLEGETYSLTSEGSGEDRTWKYGDEEAVTTGLFSKLSALTADSFTEEEPSGKEEISLKLTLDDENHPEFAIALYRYDGTDCLCTVNGDPVALVTRASAVDLIEAVNAIVLN